mmetsp:Transcript_7821/g.29276  ORF Transcript_7821/g.29276 Transcript_7821/m.29276 type:complete len:190 (-) Transcript_7821:2600-3169(-)
MFVRARGSRRRRLLHVYDHQQKANKDDISRFPLSLRSESIHFGDACEGSHVFNDTRHICIFFTFCLCPGVKLEGIKSIGVRCVAGGRTMRWRFVCNTRVCELEVVITLAICVTRAKKHNSFSLVCASVSALHPLPIILSLSRLFTLVAPLFVHTNPLPYSHNLSARLSIFFYSVLFLRHTVCGVILACH